MHVSSPSPNARLSVSIHLTMRDLDVFKAAGCYWAVCTETYGRSGQYCLLIKAAFWTNTFFCRTGVAGAAVSTSARIHL